MKLKSSYIFLFVLFTAMIFVELAFAGPGGKIASAAFESFWGKLALGGLVIIFAPFFIYVFLREKIAERRTRKDLRFMAAYSAKFDWINIQQRAKDCFYRVHCSWDNEDLSGVTNWMTDWYWQNQQIAHLNKWKKEGLKNVCNVKKIRKIKPILFIHRNNGSEHEESVLVISIEANMQDYLQNKETGKVIEGSKKYKDVETVWSFAMVDGQWKVSDIEEGQFSLAYAKLVKELPSIESTLVSELRA